MQLGLFNEHVRRYYQWVWYSDDPATEPHRVRLMLKLGAGKRSVTIIGGF